MPLSGIKRQREAGAEVKEKMPLSDIKQQREAGAEVEKKMSLSDVKQQREAGAEVKKKMSLSDIKQQQQQGNDDDIDYSSDDDDAVVTPRARSSMFTDFALFAFFAFSLPLVLSHFCSHSLACARSRYSLC